MPAIYEIGDLIVAGDDRYRVEGLLGSGGMARVYLARELTLNKVVVAKVLDPEVASQHPVSAKAFQLEARALAQMESEHLPRVNKLGVTSDPIGAHFYVMDRVIGHSLKKLIHFHTAKHGTKALRLDQALDLGSQVAEGLGTVHEYGIVHCDIKPDNLLLYLAAGGRTRVKIIDFGVSRVLDDEERTFRFMGTPAYAAPEQLLEQKIGVKADVFALGLVLFELATGGWAYATAGTEYAKACARAHQVAPSLHRFGTFPKEFVDLVARALALDPQLRPTALQMADTLRRLAREIQSLSSHSKVADIAPVSSVRPPVVKRLSYAEVSSTDVDVDMVELMRTVEVARAERADTVLDAEQAEMAVAAASVFEPVAQTVTMPARPRLPEGAESIRAAMRVLRVTEPSAPDFAAPPATLEDKKAKLSPSPRTMRCMLESHRPYVLLFSMLLGMGLARIGYVLFLSVESRTRTNVPSQRDAGVHVDAPESARSR